MGGLRFLERLRLMARNPEARVTDPVQDVLPSVIKHITAILNTRQGSSLLDNDMGTPDFTSLGVAYTASDIPEIERQLVALVSHYEPRLVNVEIHLEPNSEGRMTQMNFVLQASLRLSKSDTLPVRFLTRFTTDGRVLVEH